VAKILIVEDEFIIAWNIEEILQAFGHEVIDTVGSGEEAIALVAEQKPDLVLMDIHLQGDLDGVSTAKQLNQAQVRVVYLTAQADDQEMQRAIETNPFGYILKPFTHEQLRTAVSSALAP
jgi:CheY-like chemotaxis protein